MRFSLYTHLFIHTCFLIVYFSFICLLYPLSVYMFISQMFLCTFNVVCHETTYWLIDWFTDFFFPFICWPNSFVFQTLVHAHMTYSVFVCSIFQFNWHPGVMHPLFLTFTEESAENSFAKQADDMFKFYVLCTSAISVTIFIIQGVMLPRWVNWNEDTVSLNLSLRFLIFSPGRF